MFCLASMFLTLCDFDPRIILKVFLSTKGVTYLENQRNIFQSSSFQYFIKLSMSPGCITCKPHAGGTPVASLVYAKAEGWRAPEVQRSKEPCAEICFLLRLYAKDYSLGYIHAATPTGKLTPRRRSLGLSTWNAPWA